MIIVVFVVFVVFVVINIVIVVVFVLVAVVITNLILVVVVVFFGNKIIDKKNCQMLSKIKRTFHHVNTYWIIVKHVEGKQHVNKM